MKQESKGPRHYDDQFRLSVLKDYYESGASLREISRKYDVGTPNIKAWERRYANKVVPLPSDIEELAKKTFMSRKSKEELSENARLKSENSRLRKALEYSELRNEALREVLEIGKSRYGIDLLKKAGAKQ